LPLPSHLAFFLPSTRASFHANKPPLGVGMLKDKVFCTQKAMLFTVPKIALQCLALKFYEKRCVYKSFDGFKIRYLKLYSLEKKKMEI
jgi:hypothetical protein